MPELTPRERLQPSLLDRLLDDEPEKQTESREQRVFAIKELRAAVRRDMEWLLNTTNLAAAMDLSNHPQTARSVLNYGLPDFAGSTASGTDVRQVEREFKQSIAVFEPRVLPGTLHVELSVEESHMNHNAMTFEIHGELWAQPVPLELYMKTELDLELGNVSVKDQSAGA